MDTFGATIGYTKLANNIVDDYMCLMSPSVFKVVVVVVRKTVGWNKKADSISLTQFEKITGLSRKTVVAAIKEAVSSGWIDQKAHKNTFKYSLGQIFLNAQISVELARCSSSPSEKNPEISVQSPLKIGQEVHAQKTVTKETTQKTSSGIFPEQKESGHEAILSHVTQELEAQIHLSLGASGLSLWQKMQAKYVIVSWLMNAKTSANTILYALAYALEKGGNPGTVFNMIRTAPGYLPAWSESIDIETGEPEWKRFIWSAFAETSRFAVPDNAPFVF